MVIDANDVAELAIRLAEEAGVETIASQAAADRGERDKAFQLLGKSEGLVLASQRLQTLVRERMP